MQNSEIAGILKKAVVFEKQGSSFYSSISEKTNLRSLKRIFDTMAAEEKLHEAYLLKQLEQNSRDGSFLLPMGEDSEFADLILDRELIDEISSAGYEAAAISAAISLEVRSIDLYTAKAKSASDPGEKGFFEKLAVWENSHLRFLSELNREILEKNALQEF